MASKVEQYQAKLHDLDHYKWLLDDSLLVSPNPSKPESPRVGQSQRGYVAEDLDPVWNSVSQVAFRLRQSMTEAYQLRKDIPCGQLPAEEGEILGRLPHCIEQLCAWDPRQERLFKVFQQQVLTPEQVEASLEKATPLPLQR